MDISVIIIKVVFPLPIRQCFEYLMPDSMSPVIGGRVIVPFHSKNTVGIVISFYENTKLNRLNFKYVLSLVDQKSLYGNILLDLLTWLSNYYHCPIGIVFFSILPKYLYRGYIVKKQYVQKWCLTKKGREVDVNQFKKSKKQFHTLLVLKEKCILSSDLKKYNLSKVILKKLEIKELCKVYFVFKKSYIKKNIVMIRKKFFLNTQISSEIEKILEKNNFSSFLLTQTNLYSKVKFYLGLMSKILKKSMQILIVVSCIKDISKISFFLKKFFNVFIDIIHSKLTDSMYLKVWIKTKNGENSIIIGTKKSIFLPFFKLGLIIIDQEHSLSYKSIGKCRYNIRDISILRAYKENIPIILDSDTPSLKTLHNISCKKCCYIKIHALDQVIKLKNNIINLNQEKIQSGLSKTLINEMHKNLKKDSQVLLIFHKFNFSFFVLMCDLCGWIVKCSNCNDYYEVNAYQNILFCRCCLIKIQKPLLCYNCKRISLVIFDMGVEKIIHKIKIIFPQVPLFLLSSKKNINKNILNIKFFEFSMPGPSIILATEDIVNNYYFPYVSLISLIGIDHYLLSFQFRSMEYFGQFYINLKRLIKKTKNPFKILIQTFFPNNVHLQELCKNGYFSLAQEILILRKKFLLPPWRFQSIFYTESMSAEKNFVFLNFLRSIINKKSKKYNNVICCLNPSPCFLSRNKKKFFYQLLIESSSRLHLNKILNESINIMKFFSIFKTVIWFVDIDPS